MIYEHYLRTLNFDRLIYEPLRRKINVTGNEKIGYE